MVLYDYIRSRKQPPFVCEVVVIMCVYIVLLYMIVLVVKD